MFVGVEVGVRVGNGVFVAVAVGLGVNDGSRQIGVESIRPYGLRVDPCSS